MEEVSQTEMAEKTREPTADKASTSKKVATPEKQPKTVKMPQKGNLAKSRVSRKRQATQRYGIDVVMAISNEANERRKHADNINLHLTLITVHFFNIH